ncbi:MAG: 23S rRNA (pseudouridine(1915)-N(3))-methyltransferase RlmH [Synergistales bacterium]
MKLLFLSIGKVKSEPIRWLLADYLQRISRICPVLHETVRESRGKNPEAMREEEGERVFRMLSPRDTLVLLDEKGKMMTSPKLASWLSNKMESSEGRLCLLVGGAYGVSQKVRERADELLALSPMTFPHELCLVVLTEQIYRAFSILKGSPYHHS